MDISFELYKVFYYTATSESFSVAAEKLFITQSAVSQAIKSLEHRIGCQLFFRGKKNVRLTLEGELLFRHVEQAFNFLKTAENKLLELQNLEFGEIRIGAGDTISKIFLLPHLQSFHLYYPKIRIVILNRTSAQIADLLKEGLIDLGIATMPFEDNSISSEIFMELEDIFVASGRYPDLINTEVSLRELAAYPLLLLDKRSSTRKNLERLLEAMGVTVSPKVEAESVDLLVEMARLGFGVSHVLRESAEPYIAAGELHRIILAEELPKRKLGIITLKNVPLTTAANEFLLRLKK
jgi:DNA-binding transcriptional LysR family regulator